MERLLEQHRCLASLPLLPATQSAKPCLHQRLQQGAALRVVAKTLTRRERVEIKHKSIRKKVEGDAARPRLAVFRSINHIYAQVIDDSKSVTLAAASTLTPDIRSSLNGGTGGNKNAAELVGKKIAELCLQKSIEKVAFDRGGFEYHGRIQALADAARAGGLSF
ncbi:hypothetical protein WJX73_005166 [Symbiochloris irregularis]|uniref:Large ribosomal subunit protein uL18c n=1 Tax=Symbiochloris irregularis TaxID=706552 RepID=A0AAW1PCN4_9CHLO